MSESMLSKIERFTLTGYELVDEINDLELGADDRLELLTELDDALNLVERYLDEISVCVDDNR